MLKRSTWRWALLLPVALLGAGCFSDTERPEPTETVAFSSVHVGAFHACGLNSTGQAFCWGANGVGQLGQGGFFDQPIPQRVAQGSVGFVEIAPGGFHTCAVTANDDLHCWGDNAAGQLGQGIATAPQPQPALLVTTLDFDFVTTGAAHTCALTPAGEAWCWGLAESGRLGNGVSGINIVRPGPESVLGGLTFSALSTGGEHTCGITTDSAAYCWGGGGTGQLGDNGVTNSDTPVAVAGGLQFMQISAGGRHTCGLTPGGDAYCWGFGESGQLGNGSSSNRTVPTLVSGGLTFIRIHAGGNHSCGVTSSNEAYCWGLNDSGQVGDGSTTNRSEPTRVAGGIQFQFVEAGSGPFTTVSCGYGLDNVAYCWGYAPSGQLGSGDPDDALTPVRVAGQPG